MRSLAAVVVLSLIACREIPLAARSEERVSALLHPEEAIRARAALEMGRLQSVGYQDPLVGALRDPDAQVRSAAAFALGQLWIDRSEPGSPAVVEALLRSLADPDPSVRLAAAEALGKAGGAGVEERLASLLASFEPALRQEAATSLFRLRYLKRIPAYSSAAVRILTDSLSDPDPGTRWRAAYAFSRWAEPSAAADLREALDRQEPWLRLFALRGLSQVGEAAGEGAPETAAGLVSDPDERVRAEAVSALKAFRRADLLNGRAARDPSPHVRAAAAALANPEGLLDLLRGLEADPAAMVRAQAASSLAKRSEEGNTHAIERGAKDPHWWVRSRAVLAAGGLPKSGRPWVERALQDKDVRVRTAAIEALAGLPGVEADRALSAALVDPGSPLEVRGQAIEAVGSRGSPGLFEGLVEAYRLSTGRESVELREGVVDSAEALARSTGALAGLDAFRRRLLEDPAPSVRAKAARSLGIPHEPGTPPKPPGFEPASGASRVEVETERGTIIIELFPEDAPVHVASFLSLVRRRVYDGTPFHRVVTNFVIQGGDPRGTGWGDAGYSVPDEINRIRFERGVVGMPKAGKDTGGCQLFITLVPTPHLDGRYTAFGRVVEGLEVVDRIGPGDLILHARVR